MKILFLANRLPHADIAGGHRLIYQRMRNLADRGHQVGLAAFTGRNDATHLDTLSTWLFEVRTIPQKKQHMIVRMFRDYISKSQPAIFWKNYRSEMMRLVGDMVEESRYDIVIAEFGEMGMYLYRNPYLSAVHKVVSCHRCLTTAFSKYVETKGVPAMLRIKSASQVRILEKFEFEMYNAMDHILTLTAEDRFTLLNYAPQLPVSVIPPSIDFDYLNRDEINQKKDPLILMCGYFSDKSNHDAAIWFMENVWPLIEKNHPETSCLFIGEGASHAMQQVAKNSARIKIAGAVDDLRPYREQASVLRLGSGLRIKVLEAMGTGLPVVTTALGAAGMPAQNGVNCFIADTPELFAESVGWLLNDVKLAEIMGNRAKEMVRKRYNIESTTTGLEQLLSEVVSLHS
jgi:glycosyltransferase involved in cell wall biosynthesis